MNRDKQRVLLGMSGGVDSSVAGYLLREQGYDVIGVTMKVWPQDCISRAEDKCCGPQAIADARGVAHALGIPHYVVDEADQFERLVIDYFASEYQAGRTPNPCVMCNEKLKFGNLWSKARALGYDYKAFLRSHLGDNEFHRGEIYDVDGNFLGQHDGIELFTIGQRKGLPGGSPRPRYVADLDPETNRVIVGDAEHLVCDEFVIDRVNWHPVAGIDDPGAAITDRGYKDEFEATVKIRYNHPGTVATVTPLEHDRARVRLHEPQRAVTPGQAAVIYDDDIVLGGGWICRRAFCHPERSGAESRDLATLP